MTPGSKSEAIMERDNRTRLYDSAHLEEYFRATNIYAYQPHSKMKRLNQADKFFSANLESK